MQAIPSEFLAIDRKERANKPFNDLDLRPTDIRTSDFEDVVIEFNPERPLCSGCYAEWSQYFNYDYVEQCCHRCGEPKETTMSKPLCYDCYKKFTSF